MSSNSTLIVKPINTAPLQIRVAIPPENPQVKGYFVGHAIIRSKAENKELFERIENGDFEEDENLVRELYSSFDGIGNEQGPLTGESAYNELVAGALSAYLVPAVIQAYYAQYGEARQGNFGRRRSR